MRKISNMYRGKEIQTNKHTNKRDTDKGRYKERVPERVKEKKRVGGNTNSIELVNHFIPG